MGQTNADASYNIAWLGLCIIADISLGIIVACMLSMPKLVETKGSLLLAKLFGISRASNCVFSKFGSPDPGPFRHDRIQSTASAHSDLPHTHPIMPRNWFSAALLESNVEFDTGTYMLRAERRLN
jgi:hypothetical protein